MKCITWNHLKWFTNHVWSSTNFVFDNLVVYPAFVQNFMETTEMVARSCNHLPTDCALPYYVSPKGDWLWKFMEMMYLYHVPFHVCDTFLAHKTGMFYPHWAPLWVLASRFTFVLEDSVSFSVLVSVNNKWIFHSMEWQM